MLFLYSNKEERLMPIIVSLNNRVYKRQYACARWSPVQKQNKDYTNSTTPWQLQKQDNTYKHKSPTIIILIFK